MVAETQDSNQLEQSLNVCLLFILHAAEVVEALF